jgi:hypothetical protein
VADTAFPDPLPLITNAALGGSSGELQAHPGRDQRALLVLAAPPSASGPGSGEVGPAASRPHDVSGLGIDLETEREAPGRSVGVGGPHVKPRPCRPAQGLHSFDTELYQTPPPAPPCGVQNKEKERSITVGKEWVK